VVNNGANDMTMYKPTPAEKKIIRECAQREAGFGRVEICPSTKESIVRHCEPHMNVAMISDHPDWEDTDLFDNSYSWSDFTCGVEMTPDRRAIVDFYIYNTGYHAELQSNVWIYVEDGKLVRVEGISHGVMWGGK
jgi:hypothetical protein